MAKQIHHWLPGLDTLRRYELIWLPHDVVAGLVLATMLVPVGIAYATASGLPGIYGLYASIAPLLAYAVFGPSRILVLGPDSSLAPLILAVVVSVAADDPARAVAVGGLLAIVTGLILVLAGVLKVGFVTELLSKPIRYGYMNGIALTVLISQLPRFFGFEIDGDGALPNLAASARALAEGRLHVPTFAVGAGTLALLLVLRRFVRIPGTLLAVIAATVAVAIFGLAREGVAVLGALPRGLPMMQVPWVGFAELGT